MKISCVIPVYNEATRVSAVLDVVTKVRNISEIIVVNDASTDNSAEVILKYQVKLLNNKINVGKADALLKGVRLAMYEYVLLLDADLKNLNPEELSNVIDLTLKQNPDMVILKRNAIPGLFKIFRSDLLISGQRIIKKAEFLNVMAEKPKMYQIEIALNHYMMENKKKVFWKKITALHTYKMEKHLIVGFIRELYMFSHIFIYNLGIIKYKYFKQLFAYYPKELK